MRTDSEPAERQFSSLSPEGDSSSVRNEKPNARTDAGAGAHTPARRPRDSVPPPSTRAGAGAHHGINQSARPAGDPNGGPPKRLGAGRRVRCELCGELFPRTQVLWIRTGWWTERGRSVRERPYCQDCADELGD